MNDNNEISLGDAIKKMLDATPRVKQKINETKLLNAWETIMGKLIANNTKSITLQNKTLYIDIKSAALKNELSFSKEKIKKLINNEFDEDIIDEVRIR